MGVREIYCYMYTHTWFCRSLQALLVRSSWSSSWDILPAASKWVESVGVVSLREPADTLCFSNCVLYIHIMKPAVRHTIMILNVSIITTWMVKQIHACSCRLIPRPSFSNVPHWKAWNGPGNNEYSCIVIQSLNKFSFNKQYICTGTIT